MASSDKKKYINRREEKSRDIKKALTHRARIRKNYFKLLKNEGYQEPEKRKGIEDEEQSKEKPRPTNFQERVAIAKQRKEDKRKYKLDKIQDKLKSIEIKQQQRLIRKNQFQKSSNQKGQPLMGPRINNLLDKIKSEST